MTKLHQRLQLLSSGELSNFHLFLASPYLVKSAYVLPLFEYLRPFHPDYHQLDKMQALAAVFPERVNDRIFINQRYSELSREVENFLTFETLKEQSPTKRKLERDAFASRHMYKAFQKSCEQQLEVLEASPTHSHEEYLAYYEIYADQYNHPSRTAKASSAEDFEPMMENLDLFFILEKLKYLCDFYAQGFTYARNRPLRFEEPVMEEAEAIKDQHLSIKLFYELAQLFREEIPDERLEEVYQLFLDEGPSLSLDNRAFFLQKMVSILYSKIPTDEKYATTLFRLYQFADRQQLVIIDNKITDTTFLNICTMAASEEEVDWAEAFIRRYSPALSAPSRKEATLLGKSILKFHQRQYDEVQTLLQRIPKRGMNFKFRIRSMEVRCLLASHIEDPQYLRTVHNKLDAYRQFLNRESSLSRQRRKEYRAFCKMGKKLADLRSLEWHNQKARQAFLTAIEQEQDLALKPWLRKLIEINAESE